MRQNDKDALSDNRKGFEPCSRRFFRLHESVEVSFLIVQSTRPPVDVGYLTLSDWVARTKRIS